MAKTYATAPDTEAGGAVITPAPPKKKTRPSVPSVRDLRAELTEFLIGHVGGKMKKAGVTVGVAEGAAHLAEPRFYMETGIYGLDTLLTGGAGVPSGRFIEVFGNEGGGKTALCEFLMGCWKRKDGTLHYLDYEKSMDEDHLKCYGIEQTDFLYPDLPFLEDGWDYIANTLTGLETYATKNKVEQPPTLFIWDSLAQAVPRAEAEEDNHKDAHVGLTAKAMAKGFRKHTRQFSDANANVIFVNQVRDKIGAAGYGPKTDTPGGRAAKFAYSIRLKLSRLESVKRGDVHIGHLVEVMSVKNKHAPSGQKCRLHLSYRNGIDINKSNLIWLMEHGEVYSGGAKGLKLRGVPDAFAKKEWPAFAQAHTQEVAAAVDKIRTEMRESYSDAVSEVADEEDSDE